MKLGIFTYGTRGDLQPYIALALELKGLGYEVVIAATGNFRDYVESFGIGFQSLWGDAEHMMNDKEGHRILQAGNAIKLMKFYFEVLHRNRAALRKSYEQAVAQVDLIIANSMTLPIISALSEKYEKKMALTYFMPPVVPTREFPLADFDFLNFPFYNKLTYKVAHYFFWQFIKEDTNEYRRELGLPELKQNLIHHLETKNLLDLYCISPHLIPQPKDWAPHHKITGFINAGIAKKTAQAFDNTSQELLDWLRAGARPVYMGFGSNAIGDKLGMIRLINELLQQTNERILFCTGWSQLDGFPVNERLFITKYADHEHVLPYCKLGVFHGGAGTLATMLRHDLPVVIVSFYTDQPAWGKIIERKGLGVHIPVKKLNTSRLAAAIQQVQTETIRQNILAMGKNIRQENGLKNAVQALDTYFNLYI